MCNKLAAHHTWCGAYLRNSWAAGCCRPLFNLLPVLSMTHFPHGISASCCTCARSLRACMRFLHPVFKISAGFGFMPVALGIVLCFCFVLTSTCLDLFHASQSLLSTKLPVQDSPVNQKKRWKWGRQGFENGSNSQRGEKIKTKQATALNPKPFRGTTFTSKERKHGTMFGRVWNRAEIERF